MNDKKEIIIETSNVCKSFSNDGNQNHVLNNVDLCIYRGDFTVIMGSSGSGKSTLLYSISGMDMPTSGKVIYTSESGKTTAINSMKEKELADFRAYEFGFVFQQVHLVSNLSLIENVVCCGYLDKKKTKKEVLNRANELLDLVGLEAAKDRLPSRVSGGEAQRAAIARAIINNPGIVFADEPTGALNRKNTEDVLDLLTEFNNKGQSILMVTHDVRAAVRANRILYLEDGKICGELNLKPYSKSETDIKDREAQVNAWLTSMQW